MAKKDYGAAASASQDLVKLSEINELAQDAVGTILVDSSRIDFTYNDAVPSITADIPFGAIANTRLAPMSADTIKGRSIPGPAGDPQDLSPSTVKSMLGINMTPSTSGDTTNRTTASTSYVSLGTASITGTYPPSGMLLVATSVVITSTAGNFGLMSFEIRDTNSSGTVRRAVTDLGACLSGGTTTMGQSGLVAVTGLPTSGTMFIRPMFRVNSAVTNNFININITSIPLLT